MNNLLNSDKSEDDDEDDEEVDSTNNSNNERDKVKEAEIEAIKKQKNKNFRISKKQRKAVSRSLDHSLNMTKDLLRNGDNAKNSEVGRKDYYGSFFQKVYGKRKKRIKLKRLKN